MAEVPAAATKDVVSKISCRHAWRRRGNTARGCCCTLSEKEKGTPATPKLAHRASESSKNSRSTSGKETSGKENGKSADLFVGEDHASVACGDIQFKSLKWWQCGMVMIAETVSLGILSLPSVLSTVGLIPGFILILGMGILASYSGYTIGQFKQKYPNVNSMGDAFEILCTPLGCPKFGKEFGGAAQTLFLVFSMGSHILTWIICFNAITDYVVCDIVWGVIALLVFWLIDLPRTLKNMSHWSIACQYFPNQRPFNGLLTSSSIC